MFRPLRADDPTQVAGYRLAARLGAGGMGRVYLSHTPGGRAVAVKVVRPELADNPDFRRRFSREIQAARRVRGAYTAEVIDADADGVPPWLATLYVPGPSLAEAVARHGPLPVAAVLWLTAGVAEALQAIHDAGIVHRDLKPSNVLLASDGPRVIDFGISLTSGVTSLTATGVAVGTPEFMAPEQASVGEVTPATDVFALGQTAAFAALGEPLYGRGSSAGVLYRIVHSKPDLSVLPEPLRPLIARCLENDPAERSSLAEIVEWCRRELGQAADGDAGQGPDAGPAVWQELLGSEVEIPAPVPASVPPAAPTLLSGALVTEQYGQGALVRDVSGPPAQSPPPMTAPMTAPSWQPEWVYRRWSRGKYAAAITVAVLGCALLLMAAAGTVMNLVNRVHDGTTSASAARASARASASAAASRSAASGNGTASGTGSGSGDDAASGGGAESGVSETTTTVPGTDVKGSSGADPSSTAPATYAIHPFPLQFLDEKNSLFLTEPVTRDNRKGDLRFDCKEVGCALTSDNSVIALSYDKPGATVETCRSTLTGAKSHSLTLTVAADGSEICVKNASGDIALLVIQTKSTALWDTYGVSFLMVDLTVWRNLA